MLKYVFVRLQPPLSRNVLTAFFVRSFLTQIANESKFVRSLSPQNRNERHPSMAIKDNLAQDRAILVFGNDEPTQGGKYPPIDIYPPLKSPFCYQSKDDLISLLSVLGSQTSLVMTTNSRIATHFSMGSIESSPSWWLAIKFLGFSSFQKRSCWSGIWRLNPRSVSNKNHNPSPHDFSR